MSASASEGSGSASASSPVAGHDPSTAHGSFRSPVEDKQHGRKRLAGEPAAAAAQILRNAPGLVVVGSREEDSPGSIGTGRSAIRSKNRDVRGTVMRTTSSSSGGASDESGSISESSDSGSDESEDSDQQTDAPSLLTVSHSKEPPPVEAESDKPVYLLEAGSQNSDL